MTEIQQRGLDGEKLRIAKGGGQVERQGKRQACESAGRTAGGPEGPSAISIGSHIFR